MLAGGKHEIKALKQRLAAANACASSAMLVMDSALEIKKSMQRMLDVAMRNNEKAMKNVERTSEHLGDSLKEVRVVEDLLKEAEERWGVIEIDVAADTTPAAAAAKRRKVSESPEGVHLTTAVSPKQRKGSVSPSEGVHTDWQINSRVAATAGQSTRCTGDIRGPAGVSNDSAAKIHTSLPESVQLTAAAPRKERKGSMSPSDGVHADSQINARVDAESTHGTFGIRGPAGVSNDSAAKIHTSKGNGSGGLVAVVEGCGLLEVNGVFNYDGVRFNSTPIYMKKGLWKEKKKEYKATYKICHDTGLWHIVAKRRGQRQVYLYNNPNNRNSKMPPEKGWTVTGEGLLPAPSVRIV